VKTVRITACTFQIANFFTLKRGEVLGKRRNTKLDETKVTLKKMSNRAGATPLFRLSAAQKVRGVAPAHAAKIVPDVFSESQVGPEEEVTNQGGMACPS